MRKKSVYKLLRKVTVDSRDYFEIATYEIKDKKDAKKKLIESGESGEFLVVAVSGYLGVETVEVPKYTVKELEL